MVAITDAPGRNAFYTFLIAPLYLCGAYNLAMLLTGGEPLALSGYPAITVRVVAVNCAAAAVLLIVPVVACVLLMNHMNKLLNEERKSAEESRQLYVSRTRNTECAPTDGRIAILFTDIQDSTRLWGNVPMSMGAALDTHHAVIREVIEKHDAFEVKTAGVSFMIAVGDEERAMQVALDIQLSFMKVAFPAAIDEVYLAQGDEELDAVIDDPDIVGTPTAAWNGPRVRIGIHSGTPAVVFDEITKGYDYYGPEVNVAARVEGVAKGGQVCCTRAFADAQPELGELDYTTKSLGEMVLKGVPDLTEVMEVVCGALRNVRNFPLPGTVDDVLSDEKPSSDTGSVSSLSSAQQFDPMVAHHTAFVSTMFSVFRNATEKEEVLGRILRAWRVERQGERAGDLMYEAVARRVAGASRKARKQRNFGSASSHVSPSGSRRGSAFESNFLFPCSPTSVREGTDGRQQTLFNVPMPGEFEAHELASPAPPSRRDTLLERHTAEYKS
jgi:class 3 adenylate cyclase